jgi:single-stranded-DNA-specific exonuclease
MSEQTVQANRQVPEIVALILARRGLDSAQMDRFLYPDYDLHLHDPYLMSDMAEAVDRIVQARAAHEKVVVYGDYDIDGITASAVMLAALEALGIQAESYIPDRFEEGYGINQGALEKIQAEGAGLVVSVDCGITSVAEAEWAKTHGLDLVITDHHSVPEVIPQAIAVINPKRPGDNYPFKELAGVGVAFKLAQALAVRTGVPAAGQEKWLLDLVALGTICDVVPLVGENRVLASFGLKVMRITRRRGLRALADVSGVRMGSFGAYHAGYVFGPRMNAAGRLQHAASSLELVRTDSDERARRIASDLDELNKQRRATQDAIFAEAGAMAEQDYANDAVLVLAGENWSHGVVGIVASKIAEKWQKPTLIAQILGEKAKGSARSVGNFNMVEALRANADILERFGGHFFAAGFTLGRENLDLLRKRLNSKAQESGAQVADERPENDLELPNLDGITMQMLSELEMLEPHGNSNPRPQIGIEGLSVTRVTRMGKAKEHLKLELTDGKGGRLTAVGFGKSVQHPGLREGQRVKICGILNKNEYQGASMIQLVISEIGYE